MSRARQFVTTVFAKLAEVAPEVALSEEDASELLDLAKALDAPSPTTVLKLDEDRQMAYGFASVWSVNGQPVIDKQGDIVTADDMRDAAHLFMKEARAGGEMHTDLGIGTVVESVILDKATQSALGVDLGMEGWWIGVKVDKPEVWAKVKDGTYRAFSIGGVGTREPWTGDTATAISQADAAKMFSKGGCKYGCPDGKCSAKRHMKMKSKMAKGMGGKPCTDPKKKKGKYGKKPAMPAGRTHSAT